MLTAPAAQPAPAPPAAAAPARPRRGARLLGRLTVAVTALCAAGVVALLARPSTDPGIRVWLLNHAPDQALVINPYNGQVEKKLLVADGLKELAFSRDGRRAYIANVVDVSNRLTVLNTQTYLTEDEIEVDGVPQGIGVFPGSDELAVILGSKTDFMAGGFDVLDLARRSQADPGKRVRVYRERELALTHKIAVSGDGDRIYCIDAKQPRINIYSKSAQQPIGIVNLGGSPEEMLYPTVGDYYYVSVLQHRAIYQIDKQTDQIVGAYLHSLVGPQGSWIPGKLRFMAVDSTGDYLFGTSLEADAVCVWQVGNPENAVDFELEIPKDPSLAGMLSLAHNPPPVHYLPQTRVKLKGGYKAGISYVPGPKQVAVDELDLNLFVVDEDGALYVYDLPAVMAAEMDEVVEPRAIVSEAEGEMRDMKVTRALVRRRAGAED